MGKQYRIDKGICAEAGVRGKGAAVALWEVELEGLGQNWDWEEGGDGLTAWGKPRSAVRRVPW